jgi:plastocyanin
MKARFAILVVLAAAAALAAVGPGSAGAGATAKANAKVVKVRDDFYAPTKTTTRKGGAVKWTWGQSDVNAHNVTLTRGPKGVSKGRFSSTSGTGPMTFNRKFKVPGTYRFHCTIHPTAMKMKVVVSK